LHAREEVTAETEVQQSSHQNKDVTRAIEHSWSIGRVPQVFVKAIHVLARQQEDDQHDQAEDQVKSFHEVYGSRY